MPFDNEERKRKLAAQFGGGQPMPEENSMARFNKLDQQVFNSPQNPEADRLLKERAAGPQEQMARDQAAQKFGGMSAQEAAMYSDFINQNPNLKEDEAVKEQFLKRARMNALEQMKTQ